MFVLIHSDNGFLGAENDAKGFPEYDKACQEMARQVERRAAAEGMTLTERDELGDVRGYYGEYGGEDATVLAGYLSWTDAHLHATKDQWVIFEVEGAAMSASEIRSEIEAGTCYWHWPTGLVIFHDEDFDEPPEREDDTTFGMSVLVLDRMGDADVWDGYSPSHDDDIDRDRASELIATTRGWRTVGDVDEAYIRMAKVGVAGYGTDPRVAVGEVERNWRI